MVCRHRIYPSQASLSTELSKLEMEKEFFLRLWHACCQGGFKSWQWPCLPLEGGQDMEVEIRWRDREKERETILV